MASMKLSKACINLVKSHEGYHTKLHNGGCTTYYCPAGILTIGYGCTEGIAPGDVWTHEQAIAALKRELAKFEEAVNGLVKVEISQNAFDSLVSFSYNVGSGALSKSSLLKKVNKGNFTGAAAEFHKWNKGGGKVLPGLVRRRAAEADLFLTPDDFTEPAMPQAVDAPAPVKQMAQGSRTVFGALSGILVSVGAFFKDSVAIVVEAAGQIELLSPAMKVASALGFTTERTLFAMGLTSLALVLYAKFDDTIRGKVLK